MRLLRMIWDELVGLFIDDGALALQAVVLIAVVAGAVKGLALPANVGGYLILVGCLAALFASVFRKARGR